MRAREKCCCLLGIAASQYISRCGAIVENLTENLALARKRFGSVKTSGPNEQKTNIAALLSRLVVGARANKKKEMAREKGWRRIRRLLK